MNRKFWTPEEDKELRRSYGKQPAELIGVRLGRNKNQVIGRAGRLGLVSKPERVRGRKKVQRINLTSASKKSKPLPVETPPDEPQSLGLSIHELRDTTCRWPYGQEPPFVYCGHEAPKDEPYCPYHRSIAWVPSYWKG